MYTVEALKKYKYFKALTRFINLDYLLDPLTGLISRKYMIEFIHELIKENIPFTMAIMDLDNFKDINDNYGHSFGDIVLEQMGKDIINYLGENGVAGRFGGDEFIFIIFNKNDYDDIHGFYEGMYHSDVLRKNIAYEDTPVFITGTIGSAAFPNNATNYEELFLMSDKTLYRGKIKGRNCYIIYVHEKHKDLQIQKMVKDDEATIFYNIYQAFYNNQDFKSKFSEVEQYLKNIIRFDCMYYVDEKGDMYNFSDYKKIGENVSFDKAKFNNEIFKTNFRNDIEVIDDNLFKATKIHNISSMLVTRLKTNNKNYGYIMYAQERTSRIWQADEIATLFYLAKTLTIELI